MSKPKIRYNNELLQSYFLENNITSTTDYSNANLTREYRIKEKCVECDDLCDKTFRKFIATGCYCKKHMTQIRITKAKSTNIIRYGFENPLQSQEVRNKMKATNLEKYGFENPFQSEEIKDKIKDACFKKYGVENASQSQEVRDKIKATNLEKYGVENASQSQEVRDKMKATNLEKYGVEHPMQNAEFSEKMSKNAYKAYDYVFPSGRIERIQGYENYMLNDLLFKENVDENDIIVNRSEVPEVWYEDSNGAKHRYFVDCFIKSQNRCIETKSTWTAEKNQDIIYLKQQALKDAGYSCEIWIYNSKGEIVEKIM